jgi:hypothetical protein
MERVRNRPTEDVPRTGLESWRPAAGSRSAPHRDDAVNDDLIDILAAVLAMAVLAMIAFAS